MGIQTTLKTIHRECDVHYNKAEDFVNAGKWDLAKTEYLSFCAMTQQHFVAEEKILFPAIEEKMGTTQGPTEVMRREHQQMNYVLDDLSSAIENKDRVQFKAAGDTLLILLQQHNLKEEQILYPMADNFLADESDNILKNMQSI